MVACRSSRLFELTRSSSPWIWDFTPFGASSRMILLIFFASSWAMPCLRLALDPVLLAGGVRLTGIEAAQRDAALDQLRLEHLEHRLDALLGIGLGRIFSPL